MFYSPHRDLQVRDYQGMIAYIGNLQREVTPDIFFISSPDPRLRAKLDDWNKGNIRAIPLDQHAIQDGMSLISRIRDYVYQRDLFYETTPVRGASFFGRKTLLQSLADDVISLRVSGIFGLRKAGKTSVLYELSDQLREQSVIPILVDLEAFPSPPDDPTDDIVADIVRRLKVELDARKLPTHRIAALPINPTITEFKTALQSLLLKLQEKQITVLLLLDEIEYLTPAEKIDIAEGDMPRVSQFLAALRSVVQESKNFTFMLSGLTSAIVESGRLYGRPNPLFSWAKSYYLGPLAPLEARDLASSIGARMGIEIELGALDALYEASGGHAFLYRNLASDVVQSLPKEVFRRIIRKRDVLVELNDWKGKVAGNITEMLQHVARYYPTEAILLEVLREYPKEFADISDSEPLALRHLLEIGLLVKSDDQYEMNTLLELL